MPVTPIQSTYVSQYVPLPTDAIQNYVQRTEAAQTAEELVLDKTAEIQAVASGTTTDVDKPFLTASLGRTEADLAAIADMPTIGRARQVRLLARETAARLAPLQQRHAFRAATRADPRFAQYSPEDRATVDGMLDEELGELSEERVASGNYLPGDTFAAGFANYVDIDSNLSALVERARQQQIAPAEMASAGVDYNVTTSSEGWTPEMIRQIARHRLTTGETGAWVSQKAQLAARRNGTEVDVERQAILKEYEDNAVAMYSRTAVTNNYSQVPVDPAAAAAAAAAAAGETPADPIKFSSGTGPTTNVTYNEGAEGGRASAIDFEEYRQSHPLPAIAGLRDGLAAQIENNSVFHATNDTWMFDGIDRIFDQSGGMRDLLSTPTLSGLIEAWQGSNVTESQIARMPSIHPLLRDLASRGELYVAGQRVRAYATQRQGHAAAVARGETTGSNTDHVLFQINDTDAIRALGNKFQEIQAAIGQFDVHELRGSTVQPRMLTAESLEGWASQSYNLVDPGGSGAPRMQITMSKQGEPNRNIVVGFEGSNLGPWLSDLLVNSGSEEDKAIGALFAMEKRAPGQGPMSSISLLPNSPVNTGRDGSTSRTFRGVRGMPDNIRVARTTRTQNNRPVTTYVLRDTTTGERWNALTRAELYMRLGSYAAANQLYE